MSRDKTKMGSSAKFNVNLSHSVRAVHLYQS